MKLVDFPVVFLDEASMSTEPASLIPLMRGVRYRFTRQARMTDKRLSHSSWR